MSNSKQQIIPFGNGVIIATSRDFIDGFQAGHLIYMAATRVHTESYKDEYIISLFLEKLEDMRFSSSYGIGFAVGWLKSLATPNGH